MSIKYDGIKRNIATDMPFGLWIQNTKLDNNDVHIYEKNDVIVLGHNTKDITKCGGTPLAVVFDKAEINCQYKSSDKSVDFVRVDPEIFYKHFITFLKAVRDEALSKPIPPKPPEVNE